VSTRDVVITGIGPVSAIGTGRAATRQALESARSGIHDITLFDVEGMPTRRAAEIRDFDLEQILETRQSYLDRASQFALGATQLALDDAGLSREDVTNAALFYGSAFGCMDTMALFFEDIATKGPRLVKPFLFPHTYSNTPISLIAIEFGICGYHANYASGNVASGCAIIDAYDRIRTGRCDLALAGGVDALSLAAYEGLGELGELSPGEGGDECCAPFSARRNGTVLGEGAVTLVLESRDHAHERGAAILGEITGASLAAGVESGGYAATVHQALAAATTQTPHAICAGGNGSVEQDLWLGAGIGAFLAEQPNPIPVTSLVPIFGNTGGCASALQCAAAILIMESGVLPATLNADDPDPAATVVPITDSTREAPLENMLVTTADPGGTVATLSLCKGNT
jgi:3-oxoacyl-[acyl-carrier-protein] synthase II